MIQGINQNVKIVLSSVNMRDYKTGLNTKKERKLNKEITSRDKPRQCCNIGRTHRRNLCGIQVQRHVEGLQERKKQERTEEYEKTKVLFS
jgi:hypothetical protein